MTISDDDGFKSRMVCTFVSNFAGYWTQVAEAPERSADVKSNAMRHLESWMPDIVKVLADPALRDNQRAALAAARALVTRAATERQLAPTKDKAPKRSPARPVSLGGFGPT
jgi:hypothetical protein